MPMAMREETAASEVPVWGLLWSCRVGRWPGCQSALMRGSFLAGTGRPRNGGTLAAETAGGVAAADLFFPTARTI
jgi:hypothetical protein